MEDQDNDDIKRRLADIAGGDPFERLREHREEHPNAPIPDDLEFAALVAPIVNDGEDRISFDKVLAEKTDQLIAEDEASIGGGPYKEWRLKAFSRIDDLISKENISLERAIDRMLDELTTQGTHDDRDNLTRSYHRRAAKTLIDQIGAAIADDKQDTAVELIEKLRQRHNIFGRRWSA